MAGFKPKEYDPMKKKSMEDQYVEQARQEGNVGQRVEDFIKKKLPSYFSGFPSPTAKEIAKKKFKK